MFQFDVLYYFSSSELMVIEIKRLDRQKDSPLPEIYKWLVVTSGTAEVHELHFKSMVRGTEEFRAFLEGELRFNDRTGSLQLSGQLYHLQRLPAEEVSAATLKQIENYLAGS